MTKKTPGDTIVSHLGVNVIEINNRKFKHFDEKSFSILQEKGKILTPKELELELNIDARRISELLIWIGYRTPYKNISKEQEKYLLENQNEKMEILSKRIGLNKDTIRFFFLQKNIKLKRLGRSIKIPRNRIEEYEKDLADPFKSHVELALKWNVTDTSIAHSRKIRNYGVRKKNYDTIPELKLAKILEILDITFFQQKRISKWSIDFYLGNKICIDIHGSFFHEKEVIKNRDRSKENELLQKGYSYLSIHEYELENHIKLTKKIESFFWASLKRNFQKNNFVNPIIQGCSSIEELTVNSREDNTVPSLELLHEGVETNCKSEDELLIEARNSY